jgi:hypothetical protein
MFCADKGNSANIKEHELIFRWIYKLRGLSPQANYTDRAAAAGRRS